MNWFDQFVTNLGQQNAPFGFAPTPGVAPSQDNPAFGAGMGMIGNMGAHMLANSTRRPTEAFGSAYLDAQGQARSNSRDAMVAQQMMAEAESNRQKQQEELERKKQVEGLISTLPPQDQPLARMFPERYFGEQLNQRFAPGPEPTANMRDFQFAQANPEFETFVKGGKAPTYQQEVEQRKAAAATNGLTPDDPAYNAFILTGKMPREDQAPLTATDKKAILEADDAVMVNQSVIDQLSAVITPDATGKSLNDKAGSGALAGWQAFGARNDPTGGVLFDQEQGQATTELQNVILNQALTSLKSIFGAAPTEGERQILVDLQASIDKTPIERKAIIDRAIKMAQTRLAFNQQRAEQMRGGTYYKPGGGKSVTINGYTIEEVAP